MIAQISTLYLLYICCKFLFYHINMQVSDLNTYSFSLVIPAF